MTMTRAILTILMAAFMGCSTTRPAYGRWEQYSAESAIHFLDFDLWFTGTTRGAHRRFGSTLRWEVVYNFEARKGDERVPLTWTSGLGDIGSTTFEIGGRKYFLEMLRSQVLSDQAPDQAVAVWPEDEWESHRHPWWRIW